MKFDLYSVGLCRDNGQPTQIAGCGVILVYTDNHNRVSFRSAKYGLGYSTQNMANLQAARLALASVKSHYRDQSTVLHTNSEYVARMLKRDGQNFVMSPAKNAEIVEEMRRWFSYYKNISVIVENQNDEHMLQAKDLAEVGLATQIRSDSGTMQSFSLD